MASSLSRATNLLKCLSPGQALGLFAAQVFAYILIGAIYRLYFHPLAKFKGPKLFALTNFVQIHYVVRGEWVHKVLALHEEYGSVIRVAPNEISYVHEEAWNDIYKTPRGEPQLRKSMAWRPKSFPTNLFGQPDDAVHQVIRKKLSPILSDRGVREREDFLKKNISFLIRRLRDSISPAVVNMVGWYEAVTTDIVGDFLTKEDFGSVASGKAHPMQSEIYAQLKGLAIGTAFSKNFLLRNLIVKRIKLPLETPQHIVAKERYDRAMANATTRDNDDMFGILAKNVDTEKGLPAGLSFQVFADFILAGTDTVAITLSGMTYLLLRNRNKLQRLQDEVRSAFKSADDITLARVNALKYQNAVIAEALRLWPPGPETQRRIVNKGGKVIAGEWIPAGTHVGVYHWVAGRYRGAWKDAGSFVPERWLHDDDSSDEYNADQKGVVQPYNVGPRNCVGQQLANAELRMILANMIWHFDMQLQDPEDADWMDVKIYGLVADKKPLMVKLVYIR